MGFLSKLAKKGWFGLAGKMLFPETPDLGAAFDKQLQAQREAAKLQASNEATNVAQFDGQDPELSVGTDMRRKKKASGSYASSLGLQV